MALHGVRWLGRFEQDFRRVEPRQPARQFVAAALRERGDTVRHSLQDPDIDIILIDSPSGIGRNAISMVQAADQNIFPTQKTLLRFVR